MHSRRVVLASGVLRCERIAESEQHFYALDRSIKYDRLGVHKALLDLNISWDRKRFIIRLWAIGIVVLFLAWLAILPWWHARGKVRGAQKGMQKIVKQLEAWHATHGRYPAHRPMRLTAHLRAAVEIAGGANLTTFDPGEFNPAEHSFARTRKPSCHSHHMPQRAENIFRRSCIFIFLLVTSSRTSCGVRSPVLLRN